MRICYVMRMPALRLPTMTSQQCDAMIIVDSLASGPPTGLAIATSHCPNVSIHGSKQGSRHGEAFGRQSCMDQQAMTLADMASHSRPHSP